MAEPKTHYFYLWCHRFVDDADNIIARTCFGITGNPLRRTQDYEGHVGHVVKFARLWTGPERLIRELESRVKGDFANQIVNIGVDDEISIKELAEKILAVAAIPGTLVLKDAPVGSVKRRCGDISKFHSLTEFKAQVTLEQGIKLTLKQLL